MTETALAGTKSSCPERLNQQLIQTGPLSRLFRPIISKLAICSTLSAFGAAAGLLPYIAIAEIGRAALAAPDLSQAATTVWVWVGIGVAGAFARLILLFASSRLGHYADAQLLHDIRGKLIAHLAVLPIGWFRASGSGSIKKVMTDDLEAMHQIIAHALGEIIGATTAIVVGLAYLAWVDWRMALVVAATLLLLYVAYRVAMRSMTTHMARLFETEQKVSAASVEYADGITVVKTFGTGGRILKRFDDAVRENSAAMSAWFGETRYSSAFARILSSEMTLLGVVAASGLWMVQHDMLAMADLLPFLVVGIGLPTAVSPAIQGSQGLRKGRMAAGNVEAILKRDGLPEARQPRLPSAFDIEFSGVSFSYDGCNNVIEDLSAVCRPGTVTALVGPSGAGKSTLANLVPRFHDVTKGAIRIGGVDIRSIPNSTLLSSMSLVFQDVILLRDTVLENIRVARPQAGLDEVMVAAKAARIHDVIERMPQGYDTYLGDGAGLSGGERQRLTIARAILSGAPIVILDEATSALDPDSETAVQEALAELARGKTVLVIAHRLHTIRSADQILVLQSGRLVEQGDHDQLVAKGGLYARMWLAQEKGAAQ